MKIPQSGLWMDNPAYVLLQSHISYFGTTTAAGNAGGTSLICAGLALEPSYDGLSIKILTGGAAGQVRTIQIHGGSTILVGVGFTDSAGAAQLIAAGTGFVILSSMAGGGGPGPSPEESLTYYGIVDAVPGANQFTISGLAGLGAGKFAGATNPYQAFVLRDTGGASAAPQGEFQAITAYVTGTGVFTTAAFTAAVGVGDEILIVNPAVANVIAILAGLAVPGADSVANILERDVIGNKADTGVQALSGTSSLMRYIKGLVDMMVTATGITAWLARAKPANGVSLSEAVRDIAELKPEWNARTSATHTTAGVTEETILTTAYTTPGRFFFNLTLRNMVAGDDYTIRVYKRTDGANYDLVSEQQFLGNPSTDIYEVRDMYTDGTEFVRVTIQRASGTDRAFPYSYNIEKQAVV